MIDRCLVAAYDASMHPIPHQSRPGQPAATDLYVTLNLDIYISTIDETNNFADVGAIADALVNHVSVLVGHSGVGKSTLSTHSFPLPSAKPGKSMP